jgi:hypothetical protein
MNKKNERKVLVKARGTEIFDNGDYRYEMSDSEGINVVPIEGSVYEFYDIVSAQFNQLKAKLFNLIEASSPDKTQQEAVKGLIRGFCNEHYKNSVGDLAGLMERIGVIEDKYDAETLAIDPLGSRE